MSEKNKELLLIFTQYSETFVAMIKLSSVQGCHECQSGQGEQCTFNAAYVIFLKH